MLSVDDLTSNYVVYCPVSYERQEDDWLLDIELYSESYRTDAVSNWMQELDILDNPSMRKLVKHYRKFFGAQARRAKIMAQDKIPATPAQLHMAVMAALCGMKKAQPNEILLNVLRGGLDKAQNPIYQSFVDASIAVEWNQDVNYYSNIIESLSRDIHCYCIQTNTSKYGDSRITKPSKTENKDILRIKGGSNATAHVGTIDLEQLREFQMKAYSGQKEDKTFKPTPPDFDYKGAYERRKGTMFECFCAKKKAD